MFAVMSVVTNRATTTTNESEYPSLRATAPCLDKPLHLLLLINDMSAVAETPAGRVKHRPETWSIPVPSRPEPSRTRLRVFDAIQLVFLRRCQIWHGLVDAGRKLEVQIRLVIDAKLAASYLELEQMSPSATVLGNEVEVVTRHVEPPDVVREAKAHQAAPDVV